MKDFHDNFFKKNHIMINLKLLPKPGYNTGAAVLHILNKRSNMRGLFLVALLCLLQICFGKGNSYFKSQRYHYRRIFELFQYKKVQQCRAATLRIGTEPVNLFILILLRSSWIESSLDLLKTRSALKPFTPVQGGQGKLNWRWAFLGSTYNVTWCLRLLVWQCGKGSGSY